MADFLIILVVLTNLRMLATSRLDSLISWAAIQGMLLGLFALLARWAHLTPDVFVVGVVAFVLKGIIFPRFLRQLAETVHVGRELEPFVGYIASTLIGLVALIVSLWLGARLPIPGNDMSALMVPATLFSIFSGLFLIISRKKAITQVVGFLVMENGAFMLGVGTLYYAPFLVEMGTLLDMFVAVLIWTILIRFMNRAFHHIDTEKLQRLKG
jgi:hydrogenase-4 component E